MKSILIIISIFGIPAIASFPWAFFARVNKTFEPLFGIYLGERFNNMSMFGHRDSLASPTEFDLIGDYAIISGGNKAQYVGFKLDRLVYGPNVPFSPLKLDMSRKVHAQFFYSCDLLGGTARGIFYGESAKNAKYCFRVEIYFLPYNPNTKSAVFPLNDFIPGVHVETLGVDWPCAHRFKTKNGIDDLTDFLHHYNGPCDIYINDKLVTKDELRSRWLFKHGVSL